MTDKLTQWCKTFLEKFLVTQPARNWMLFFILNQLNPVHTLLSSYSKIHFDIILWSVGRYRILLSYLLIKIVYVLIFLIFSMHTKCPACCALLDLGTLIIFVKNTNYEASHHVCNYLYPSVTPCLLGPNILSRTWFSNKFKFNFLLKLRGWVRVCARKLSLPLIHYFFHCRCSLVSHFFPFWVSLVLLLEMKICYDQWTELNLNLL